MLLKIRAPKIISPKPNSLLQTKFSWPSPWYSRKNAQTNMTRICSTIWRCAAEVDFRVTPPNPLKQADARMKQRESHMIVLFSPKWYNTCQKSSMCPLTQYLGWKGQPVF